MAGWVDEVDEQGGRGGRLEGGLTMRTNMARGLEFRGRSDGRLTFGLGSAPKAISPRRTQQDGNNGPHHDVSGRGS